MAHRDSGTATLHPSRAGFDPLAFSYRVDLPTTRNHGFILPTGLISGVRDGERETLPITKGVQLPFLDTALRANRLATQLKSRVGSLPVRFWN
jgi:hypothetical protein